MTRLQELNAAGQSPWLDYIRRDMIENGELARSVSAGIKGVTSNPTIFENAIAKSTLYQTDIQKLSGLGKSTMEIYEELVLADIKGAADVLLPVYKETNGGDGYVSLEVPPALCDDHEATVAEGKRLWKLIDRPNLMIKVPATEQGLPAITELIAEGVNVNVTLMFTMQDYLDVTEAYLAGLEQRLQRGEDLKTVASVASIFVSRIDSAIEQIATGPLYDTLLGKVAVANAQLMYRAFTEIFSSERFKRLAAHGARLQRPLFASTGTKNKALSDVLYVETLIGPDTINTMPPQTLDAFIDHGIVARTVDQDFAQAEEILGICANNRIDLEQVGRELKQKGLQAFKDSFVGLMSAVEQASAKSGSKA